MFKAFLLLLLLSLFSAPVSSEVTPEYSRLCDSTFCRVLEKYHSEIHQLKKPVDEGNCIPQFGLKSDEICNKAIEEFSLEATIPDDNSDNEALFDKKIEDLEKLLDAPLHVLYLKQLQFLKEKSLRQFRQALTTSDNAAGSGGTEYEAMSSADELFRKEAEEYTRQNPDWSYSKEASLLKSTFLEILTKNRKIAEIKAKANKQQQQSMQYLQIQNQQLQAMQQQVMGSSSPWNVGMAYRIPDTNINVQLSYQQGKGNVQVSCVPDEASSLLGPNGFVHGVTPGNVGLSFNINI